MKNKFAIFISGILLFAVLGCGISDRIQNAVAEKPANSSSGNTSTSENKTISDQVTEDVLREKTGVPECDEVIDFFADQAKNQEDDFVSKATKEFVFNKIRQSFKESIEKNKGDREKMAQNCKDYKAQLEKYKAEQNTNK
jgi:hypothetical protein